MKYLSGATFDGQSFARPPLALELAGALRELILEGQIAEGEKIREKVLTERFAVSRTPLREAMKMLASEGLIELIPNRGAVVSRQSDTELAENFQVLSVLERLAGELAAIHATEAEIARIGEMTTELRRNIDMANRSAYFSINQSIHNAILAAARNDALSRIHVTVASRVHRARYQANLSIDRWKAAMDEHDKILSALQSREPELLGALLHDHMLAKLASVVKSRKENLGNTAG